MMTATGRLSAGGLRKFCQQLLHSGEATGPIGFDLGLEKLNMVQVHRAAGHPAIHAAASEYHDSSYDELLTDPKAMRALLRKIWKSQPFRGRRVVSSLPCSKLRLIFLNYHQGQQHSEDQAILNALQRRIDTGLDGFVIDYTPIKPEISDQAERTALVAMARQDDVEDYLELLRGCGLHVDALEIGPVAIRRLIGQITYRQGPQKILAINFGTEKSYLTVIWNNDLLLDREVGFGMENILTAIAKSFDIKNKLALEILHKYGLAEAQQRVPAIIGLADDDLGDVEIRNALADILQPSFVKLAAEIRDVLVYVASETRGGAVEQIFLLGSLARLSGIDEIIDRLISIPVATINPFYGIAVENAASSLEDLGPMAGIAVATGLALRGEGKHA